MWYRLSSFRTLEIGKRCNLSINMICVCMCQHCPSLPLELMVWMCFYSYYSHLFSEHYNLCINISSLQRSGMQRKPRNIFLETKPVSTWSLQVERYYLFSEELTFHWKVMNKALVCSFFWVTRHLRCTWSRAKVLDNPSVPLESCPTWAESNFLL